MVSARVGCEARCLGFHAHAHDGAVAWPNATTTEGQRSIFEAMRLLRSITCSTPARRGCSDPKWTCCRRMRGREGGDGKTREPISIRKGYCIGPRAMFRPNQ